MTEQRHDRVRELVAELLATAPPAPPFPNAEAATLPVLHPRRLPARPMLVAAIIVAVLAIALGAIASIGGDDDRPPVITTPPGTGRSIAYVGDDGLYLVPPDGGDARRVVDGPGIVRPRFSYDAEQLAFEKLGQLWTYSDDAGTAPIVNGPGRWAWSPTDGSIAVFGDFAHRKGLHVLRQPSNDEIAFVGNATDFTWMPDGSLLVSVRAEQPVLHDELYRVTPGDSSSEAKTEPYAAGVDFHDADDYGLVLGPVSPKGDPVVWVDPAYGSSSAMMDAPPLDVVHDGRAVELGGMFVQRPWAQWSRDGRLAFVETTGRMVTDGRTVHVCDTALACTPLRTAGQTSDPAWSPDGTQLAFVRNDASTDPGDWVHDGEPDWVPRYAHRRLWVANADGSAPRELATAGTAIGSPVWLTDDNLLFTQGTELRVLDVPRGTVRVVGHVDVAGRESPAGQVYDPSDANGELQWSDLYAVAPVRSEKPVPGTTTTVPTTTPAPTATSVPPTTTTTTTAAPPAPPTVVPAAEWTGHRYHASNDGPKLVVDDAPSDLEEWISACLDLDCVYSATLVSASPPGAGAVHGFLWLGHADPASGPAAPVWDIIDAYTVDFSADFRLDMDACHDRQFPSFDLPAIVPRVPVEIAGIYHPARAWELYEGSRLRELPPDVVDCTVNVP